MTMAHALEEETRDHHVVEGQGWVWDEKEETRPLRSNRSMLHATSTTPLAIQTLHSLKTIDEPPSGMARQPYCMSVSVVVPSSSFVFYKDR